MCDFAPRIFDWARTYLFRLAGSAGKILANLYDLVRAQLKESI